MKIILLLLIFGISYSAKAQQKQLPSEQATPLPVAIKVIAQPAMQRTVVIPASGMSLPDSLRIRTQRAASPANMKIVNPATDTTTAVKPSDRPVSRK